MLNGTGLLYTVGLGELMITWGGSLIGGIGVAGFPQVGLASATSSNAKDSFRITITKIVAITALLMATNPALFYSIVILLLLVLLMEHLTNGLFQIGTLLISYGFWIESILLSLCSIFEKRFVAGPLGFEHTTNSACMTR